MAPRGFTFSSDPSPEVSAYLRQKGLRPAFRHSEVWGEEHAYAFTVAKAVQADVLRTIHESLQWSVDQGVPFDTWRRNLTPELQRLGWWGAVPMADPATGEVAERELGSPRRLRTLFDANLRPARAAGQWERAQRTKAVLPFFVYSLGPSERHRPHHEAMAGTVRPVDDPIWDVWFCPNGWGCKCHLRQITRAEAERRGVTPPWTPQPIVHERRRDDGTVERVPGVAGIDAGWANNPGKNRAQTLMTNLTRRLAQAGEPAARELIADLWAGSTPETLSRLGRRVLAPVAVASQAVRDELGVSHPVVMVGADTVAQKSDAPHHSRGARPTTPQSFGRVQAILDRGELIDRDGRRRTYVLRMDDGLWMTAVNATHQGEIVVRTLYAIDEERLTRLRERGRRRAEGR